MYAVKPLQYSVTSLSNVLLYFCHLFYVPTVKFFILQGEISFWKKFFPALYLASKTQKLHI